MNSDLRPVLTIDLDAIAENYRRLRQHAGGRSGAVVKADGYGLGAERVVSRLLREGCETFFVATLAEAEQLRQEHPAIRLVVFEGITSAVIDRYREQNLTPTLNTLEQLSLWPSSAEAFLHIDTGMSRLGLSPAETAALLSSPTHLTQSSVSTLMTHFVDADEETPELTDRQCQDFFQFADQFPALDRSVGNTAGLLYVDDLRGSLGRPGIGLYGANPRRSADHFGVPVATLTAPVWQVREIPEGASVGYNATFTTSRPRTIATVGLGYADGLFRSTSNKGHVIIDGHACPIVGRVSMDSVGVDVTAMRSVCIVGAQAEVIGPSRSLEAAADDAGTISYEVLTSLGGRIARRYI
ncbi:MAG: alanine racemase [Parvularculaceae bacterium]|nr:alanine racemase [Parvularculaceae bacterium]